MGRGEWSATSRCRTKTPIANCGGEIGPSFRVRLINRDKFEGPDIVGAKVVACAALGFSLQHLIWRIDI